MTKTSIHCWICRKGSTPYLSYRCLYRPMAFDGVFPWYHGKHLFLVVNGKRFRGCK